MLRSYLIAIQRADWRSPVLLAIFGVVLFFVWNIMRLGAPGRVPPLTHLVGACMVSVGWLSIGLAGVLMWHGIQAERTDN